MNSAVTVILFWRVRAFKLSRGFAGLAGLTLFAFPAYLLAQSATQTAAQSAAVSASTSSDSGDTESAPSGIASPLKALPRGFYLQDASILSSGLLTSSPGPMSASSSSPDSNFQTGVGYAFDGGYAKTTPLTIYSILYATSFTSYQKSNGAMDWNQYLSASVNKRFSPRINASFSSRVALTDDRQYLFGATPGSSSEILSSSNLLEQSSTPRTVSNLLLTWRDLLVTVGGDISYEYSPRTTVSVAIQAVRNQALGSNNEAVLGEQSRSNSGSVTATLAHALSARENVEVSVASTKTLSSFENSNFTSALAAFSYALTQQWFFKVQAGADVEQGSAVKRSTLRPVGGGTLGYAKGSWQLLLSSTQNVVQIYGAGAGVVWSSNLGWVFAPTNSRWSLMIGSSFDRTNAIAGQDVQGWRASTELRRALTHHISLGGQYAYLLNSYRGPANVPGLNTQGVRLSLGFSPGRGVH